MFSKHAIIEKNLFILLVGMVIMISFGTIIEIFPLFIKDLAIEKVQGMRPHSPLELMGFEIYKREGCYNCHSQQVRVLRDEVERYGHYSLAAESMYDHPFVWGSKRTGPDLARVGGKYSDEWHVTHLMHPQSLVPESIMPRYEFMLHRRLNTNNIQDYMRLLNAVGTPYDDYTIHYADSLVKVQLGLHTDNDMVAKFKAAYPKAFIRKFNGKSEDVTEMDALVAYLQSLGNRVDLKTNKGRDW